MKEVELIFLQTKVWPKSISYYYPTRRTITESINYRQLKTHLLHVSHTFLVFLAASIVRWLEMW